MVNKLPGFTLPTQAECIEDVLISGKDTSSHDKTHLSKLKSLF
jgi:hypothetical protein